MARKGSRTRSSVAKSSKKCRGVKYSPRRSLKMYAKSLKAYKKAHPKSGVKSARKAAKKMYRKSRRKNFDCYA
jgi:hypothetical protein